jgi:ketosteroid isomerase-like protein
MSARSTIEGYFGALKQKSDWASYLSDDVVFTSYTCPVKTINGKTSYLESTKRFYSTIKAMEVRQLIVDGDRVCALARYELQPPQRPAFQGDVAEVFRVRDDKISSFDIYFDSAPFPK